MGTIDQCTLGSTVPTELSSSGRLRLREHAKPSVIFWAVYVAAAHRLAMSCRRTLELGRRDPGAGTMGATGIMGGAAGSGFT